MVAALAEVVTSMAKDDKAVSAAIDGVTVILRSLGE